MNKVYVYDAGAEATRAGEPTDNYVTLVYVGDAPSAIVNRFEVSAYADFTTVRFLRLEVNAGRCREPLMVRMPLPAARALADHLHAALDANERNREAGKKGRYARKARSRGGDGETPNPAAEALPGGPEVR